MIMDLVVEVPRKLIIEAVKEMSKIPCKRLQPVFNLFPSGRWELDFVCGTNRGIGSDNGYGVGYHCSFDCDLRIPDNSLHSTNKEREI